MSGIENSFTGSERSEVEWEEQEEASESAEVRYHHFSSPADHLRFDF